MMGASSSAMHAQSTRRRSQIRKEISEGNNDEALLEEAHNYETDAVPDKATQDLNKDGKERSAQANAKTRSIDTKTEIKEKSAPSKSTSDVDNMNCDEALKNLDLSEHDIKSANNVMKKNKDIYNQLLDCVKAVVSMKIGNDHDTCIYIERMNFGFFEVAAEKRIVIGNFLKDIKFSPVSFQTYKQVLQNLDLETFNEKKLTDDEISQMMFLLRGHWWNFSDCSTIFASALITDGIVQEMMQDIKNMVGVDEKTLKYSFTFESAIGVLHNVAKIENHRQYFRDLKTVDILGNFLTYEELAKVTMLVLLTLALIIDENQTDLLFSHESSFDLILRLAKRAWKKPDHRYDGFSLEELVLGLRGLSKNDKVKRLLVEKGILTLVSEILVDGNVEEKEIAAELLWELSFNSDNKTTILENEAIMTTLKTVSKMSGKIARSAQGVMWVLEMEGKRKELTGKLFAKKNKVESEKSASVSKTSGKSNSQGHIMISYNWSDQKQLILVKETLKSHGFSVWMDIDNISGSTLQAMAEAVEGSAVVLVCMSEKYKESTNCRSEAEYAFSLQKTIIPLLLQEKYKPDGWLGILLGTKLFFDFSGRYSFDAKVSELEKELMGRGIAIGASEDVTDGPIVKTVVPLVGKAPKSQMLTQVDVKAWILEHKLGKYPVFDSVEAAHLKYLKEMSMKAPEFYYSFVLDLIHGKRTVEDLNGLMEVTSAIGKLPS